jgi:hypothetical protein
VHDVIVRDGLGELFSGIDKRLLEPERQKVSMDETKVLRKGQNDGNVKVFGGFRMDQFSSAGSKKDGDLFLRT